MRHSTPASLALSSLLALILISTAHAQINGAPASVTSPGFGGHSVNGTPPSVTSLGPRGYAPNSRVTFSTPNAPRTFHGHHHRHNYVEYAPALVYAVPYAIDLGATDDANADDPDGDPEYQGGPTLLDRRGHGASSYIPPVQDTYKPHAMQPADQSNAFADPDPPQEPTLLIFKDGRKLELRNYAIIGVTLFDLTPGHTRRIALADLDLDATRKQNDDRGITFQLPASAQAN
ncbi:MAG: hypothetical protein DMG79_21635 [Acidobacteria bacterium]|nr:MAG: hypothetical protein DMG79_21635 [Acidobacteriota bacterium]